MEDIRSDDHETDTEADPDEPPPEPRRANGERVTSIIAPPDEHRPGDG